MIRRAVVPALALGLVVVSCTPSADEPRKPATTRSAMQAFMATTDLYVGPPQRVGVGLPLSDGRLVSFGRVSFAFSYLGPASSPSTGPPEPSVEARYVATPGTPAGGDTVRITDPSDARGIYQAEDVRFDRAGFWQVAVSADVEGERMRATAAFRVADHPALPAPGQPAPHTENLTIRSKDAPPAAIDSRAVTDGTVPDPELHRSTIAEALRRRRPVVAVFATPLYCVSEFCGPVTDSVDDLWRRFKDRAVFIHIEIYRDYNARPQQINKAAADWLLRDGDLTEPWLYLIGADGTILDRWSSVFDPADVARELRRLPTMR